MILLEQGEAAAIATLTVAAIEPVLQVDLTAGRSGDRVPVDAHGVAVELSWTSPQGPSLLYLLPAVAACCHACLAEHRDASPVLVLLRRTNDHDNEVPVHVHAPPESNPVVLVGTRPVAVLNGDEHLPSLVSLAGSHVTLVHNDGASGQRLVAVAAKVGNGVRRPDHGNVAGQGHLGDVSDMGQRSCSGHRRPQSPCR